MPWRESAVALKEHDRVTSEADTTDKKRRCSLKPLTSLLPYLQRYRGRRLPAALIFLASPPRHDARPADRHPPDARPRFQASDSNFINKYFAMMIVMAIVLAVASALRYYYVITIGETRGGGPASRCLRACDEAVPSPSSTSTSRGKSFSRLDCRHHSAEIRRGRPRLRWRCATRSSVSAPS